MNDGKHHQVCSFDYNGLFTTFKVETPIALKDLP